MPNNKPTPIPPEVQAKMQSGVRQRYAMATTPSAQPADKREDRGE